MREAIICSFKGKVAHTICYPGHDTSVLAILDKLNGVYGAVASYDMLIQKSYQVAHERASPSPTI